MYLQEFEILKQLPGLSVLANTLSIRSYYRTLLTVARIYISMGIFVMIQAAFNFSKSTPHL